jgi:hypothetical protein
MGAWGVLAVPAAGVAAAVAAVAVFGVRDVWVWWRGRRRVRAAVEGEVARYAHRFETRTCIVLVCDGGCDDTWDDEEGIIHFESQPEAAEFASDRGWLLADGRSLCPRCAQREECDRLGHLWGGWESQDRDGIAFRSRWCERDLCSMRDYDPPFAVLYPKFQALRDAEEVLRAADLS